MADMTGPLQAASYDYPLAALSILVAVFTAYTAADILWRTSISDADKTRTRWFWTGGVVLGLGAWTAHLTGMLAAKEHFSFIYRTDITVVSILLVLAGSVGALYLISRCRRAACLFAGGALLGLGLVAMCFTGMHAVLMPGMQHSYDYGLVALSYAVAAVFSVMALRVLRRFYHGGSVNPGWEKVAFSILMASAVIGMHYTDMASMQMTMLPAGMDMAGMPGMDMPGMPGMAPDIVDSKTMAVAVSAVMAALMLIALWTSHLYYRNSLREKKLLQEAKEYANIILRDIVEGVIVIDEQGLIQSLNPAAASAFGYSAAEVTGKNVAVLIPEPHRRHDGDIRHYLETGTGKVIGAGPREVEGLRKDGTVFPLEVAVSEVRFGGRRLFAGVVRDITRRKEAEARLTYLAHHDPLTGLLSRALFRDRAAQALRHADRAERLVAIMYVDLDRFKDINDSLGHEVGDNLLREVAKRITACLRAGDTVSRLGGDEFAIVLENLSGTEDAAAVAGKILEDVAEPFEIDGHEIRVGASIGMTIYPFDDQDLDGLLRDADAAMYRAKQQGRNQLQFYSTEMAPKVHMPADLEEDIEGAFARGELRVYYQPRVDLLTGEITEVEALLRWQHPEHGLLEAHEFVPLLEKGQIGPVSEWVLRTACAQFRAWRDAGRPLTRLTVNLSFAEFRDTKLPEKVRRILEQAELPADCLELDIPGSYFDLGRDARCTAVTEEIRKLGVHLTLEDSRTGYSFVELLHRSPIDTLKIERDLVRDMHVDRDRATALQALIAMARVLKLRVVAEGVESEEELALLRQYGCDAVQGYLFSQAKPPEELNRLFASRKSHQATSSRMLG